MRFLNSIRTRALCGCSLFRYGSAMKIANTVQSSVFSRSSSNIAKINGNISNLNLRGLTSAIDVDNTQHGNSNRLQMVILTCATLFIAATSLPTDQAHCDAKPDLPTKKTTEKEMENKSGEQKEEESSSKKDAAPEKQDIREKVTANYAAVMLKSESVNLLKKKVPALFPDNEYYHHMTVKWAPGEKDIEEMDDLLDNDVTLKVIGVAQDEHCQALLVKSEHLHIHSANRFPHITLSVRKGNSDLYHPFYSNELFERIFNEGFSKNGTTDTGKADYELLNKDWTGVLPKKGKYAESSATFKLLLDEEIQLEGCFCLDTKWDGNESKCNYVRENQCGFCLFMKGGPCRKEFIQWEDCVGVSKDGEDDEDFVDRCAPQTLLLKTCVDNHPEYYYIVTEDEDDKNKNEVEKEENITENKKTQT